MELSMRLFVTGLVLLLPSFYLINHENIFNLTQSDLTVLFFIMVGSFIMTALSLMFYVWG